ncbi:MAG: thrombospondin type 3 repeat-containing protein [Myxococcales bacterium]|nr:thrombospondin type 3 repeat-containing protein [Myxococcales bacterium]
MWMWVMAAWAADADLDGVDDSIDNCRDVSNAEQRDVDLDGLGDVCDNCPTAVNPDQHDNDRDGFGAACDRCDWLAWPTNDDEDTDGDGVADSCDNCPFDANPDQADADLDVIGDLCDPQTDPLLGSEPGCRHSTAHASWWAVWGLLALQWARRRSRARFQRRRVARIDAVRTRR